MFQLGEYQELYCVKKVDFGVYLSEDLRGEERVLLPAAQVPQGIQTGDKLRVFLYKDSKARLIATTKEAKLVMGRISRLTVNEVTRIGAFLDWGLDKDLFLPYKEMTGRVKAGDAILVRLYTDKSERLCASMRGLYHLLSKNPPYQIGDAVTGCVYEFSDNFGAFVAVDGKYSAKIVQGEDYSYLHIGDTIEAKVVNVKEDGKLDLTLREKAYIQMDADAQKLLELLEAYGGVLPFTEKASPQVIMRETGLSKNAFKRAIGRLYKERTISLENGTIRLI